MLQSYYKVYSIVITDTVKFVRAKRRLSVMDDSKPADFITSFCLSEICSKDDFYISFRLLFLKSGKTIQQDFIDDMENKVGIKLVYRNAI